MQDESCRLREASTRPAAEARFYRLVRTIDRSKKGNGIFWKNGLIALAPGEAGVYEIATVDNTERFAEGNGSEVFCASSVSRIL